MIYYLECERAQNLAPNFEHDVTQSLLDVLWLTAYFDLLKISTENVPVKCITIAKRGTFSDFRHIFSPIGIVMSNGNCGQGPPTR